jgi:acyl carrier protein
MNRKEFLARLDEIMERTPGTTRADEVLASVDAWDSLALMSFIALADSEFGLRIAGPKLAACKTVADLLALVGDKVTD